MWCLSITFTCWCVAIRSYFFVPIFVGVAVVPVVTFVIGAVCSIFIVVVSSIGGFIVVTTIRF